MPGGSFSRDLATTVLSAYFPIHLELEPIRDLEGGIVDWRIVSVVSQPANAPTGVAPETVGSRILDLVPSVRSMPVFNELREVTGGPSGLTGIPNLWLFGAPLNTDVRYYYLVWAFALGVIFLSRNIIRKQ